MPLVKNSSINSIDDSFELNILDKKPEKPKRARLQSFSQPPMPKVKKPSEYSESNGIDFTTPSVTNKTKAKHVVIGDISEDSYDNSHTNSYSTR